MADLLVRGGEVLDGTGQPAVSADVRIRGGLIAEVGPNLRPDGEPELDASGAVVSPGFIDTHTHFDPSLFWDPFCDPMPQHGVTSVLVGNCSLSLAPVREDQRETLGALFCYVEDLPTQSFDTSVPWTWRSYDEYLQVLADRRLGVNVATLVGHTALRMWVMGDESWERPADERERAAIAAALDDCLAAGAFGMSTSLGFDEHPVRGPVPSRVADDDEFAALVDALADRRRFVQFIPTPGFGALKRDVERLVRLCQRRDVLNTWIGIFTDNDRPQHAPELLEFAAGLQAAGARTYPQVSPRTLDVHVNWSGGMSFAALAEGWGRFVQAPPQEKAALIGDPEWRTIARDEWDRTKRAMIPHRHPERIRLVSATSPSGQRWVGATLADLVAERGGHPSDVLADWVAENDLDPGIVGVGVGNADADQVADTLRHPAALISNSDAGAHLQMMCAAGDTTLLLTKFVRDRGDLTLEDAVRSLTSRQAELFGFRDRGVVSAGAIGDLTVFALDDLHWDTDVFVDDLPAGASRLRRPPGGYRATVVAGEITQLGGEPTEARSGAILRAS